MEGFSFVKPVTGLNGPNTGKEEDDDDSTSTIFLRKDVIGGCMRWAGRRLRMGKE
jgi:hypothetical protein